MSEEPLCRRHMSLQHLEVLAQYMERYPALALASARSREGHLQSKRMWDKIARTLNRIEDGLTKDGRSWSRYWYDLKFKIRRKYMLQQSCVSKNSPRVVHFNPIEQRIIKLLTDKDGNLLAPASLYSFEGYGSMPRWKSIQNTGPSKPTEERQSRDADSDCKIDDSGGPDTIDSATIDITFIDKRLEQTSPDHNSNIDTKHTLEDPIQILLPEEKKSIEELRREIVEFELKKQKELFEIEVQQMREKHKVELSILRIKEQIMLKELKKL